MLSAGIVSFYHPGSILFCRHEPPVSTWSSAKIHHQISLRMHSCFSPSQAFEGSFQASFPYYRNIKCETARRNHYQGFSSDDGFDQKPFWLTMIHDIAQNLRSLALFLLEQPSQLKYIEWPSLQSTRSYFVRTPDTTYRPEANKMQPRHPVPSSGIEPRYRAGGDVAHFHWAPDGVRRPHRISEDGYPHPYSCSYAHCFIGLC